MVKDSEYSKELAIEFIEGYEYFPVKKTNFTSDAGYELYLIDIEKEIISDVFFISDTSSLYVKTISITLYQNKMEVRFHYLENNNDNTSTEYFSDPLHITNHIELERFLALYLKFND
jgi:hypothetical protein